MRISDWSSDVCSSDLQQERLVEAEAMLAALESESGDPELPAVRAHVLDKLGRADEARAIQQRLTEIEPDKPAHRVAFGHNLRAAGEVEAAIASYRKAATLDYEFGEAWWSLASIKRKVLTDADEIGQENG